MPKISGETVGKILTLLGYDGADFRAFLVDSDGHLQVDVLTGGGVGDATAANQAIMITALQKIDDLQGALGTVDTDDLQVDVKTSGLPTGASTSANQDTLTGKFKDQAFTYKGQLLKSDNNNNASSGTNYLNIGPVPSGEVWVVTTASCYNGDTICSRMGLRVDDQTNKHIIIYAINQPVSVTLTVEFTAVLVEGDELEALFVGCSSGDDIFLSAFGYKMTV